MGNVPTEESNKCELFGPFGFLVQFTLGCMCFGSLILKRQFEHPKRSIRIWLLDISKQGICLGSVTIKIKVSSLSSFISCSTTTSLKSNNILPVSTESYNTSISSLNSLSRSSSIKRNCFGISI